MKTVCFAPNDSITGAEAVKLAACLGQLLSEGSVSLTNGSPWYESYMEYAVENGIIDSALDPYTARAPIMRAELMDMVCRAIPPSQRKEINSIPDGSIPDLRTYADYRDNVYTLYRMGILTGSDKRGSCFPERRSAAPRSRRSLPAQSTRTCGLCSALRRLPPHSPSCASVRRMMVRSAPQHSLAMPRPYDESAAEKLYPFLTEVPAENCVVTGGEELHFIVPCQGVTARVYAYDFDWAGDGGYTRGELLAEFNGEPFLLRCNFSDIVTNTLIVFTAENGRTLSYSPSISLEDGTLAVPESGVYDFTRY